MLGTAVSKCFINTSSSNPHINSSVFNRMTVFENEETGTVMGSDFLNIPQIEIVLLIFKPVSSGCRMCALNHFALLSLYLQSFILLFGG